MAVEADAAAFVRGRGDGWGVSQVGSGSQTRRKRRNNLKSLGKKIKIICLVKREFQTFCLQDLEKLEVMFANVIFGGYSSACLNVPTLICYTINSNNRSDIKLYVALFSACQKHHPVKIAGSSSVVGQLNYSCLDACHSFALNSRLLLLFSQGTSTHQCQKGSERKTEQ